MKIIFTSFIFLFALTCSAQLEVSSGYAVNKVLAEGAPLQPAYDFKIKERLYTKTQVGYKYLYHFNDFVEARLRWYITELHQTLSYRLINHGKYILQPNLGLNFRYYSIDASIDGPYNVLPQRVYIINGVRGNSIRLNNYDGDGTRRGKRNIYNVGFTIQIQNQFKVNEKIWVHVTPFLEPDYDRIQNTGGCYVGVIFKQTGK